MELRAQRRREVREALTDAAYRLVARHGWEGTTVDAVAAAAGVGRTTAFRHFPTKEDLLLGWLDEVRERLAGGLAARPADEPPMAALRSALAGLADVYVAHRDRTLAVAQLAATVPSVRARYLERKQRWEAVIAADVAARIGADPDRDLGPRLVAQVALAATSAATEQWLQGGATEDLPALVDLALERIARGL